MIRKNYCKAWAILAVCSSALFSCSSQSYTLTKGPGAVTLHVSLVVIGDSWFAYPNFLEHNTGWHMSKDSFEVPSLRIGDATRPVRVRYNVYNRAINGQTIAQVLDGDDWWKAISAVDPVAVVLSAGGNDFLDESAIRNIVKPRGLIRAECGKPQNPPQCYVDDQALNGRFSEIKLRIEAVLGLMPSIEQEALIVAGQKGTATTPGRQPIRVLVHGYDYTLQRANISCHLLQRIFSRCEWVRPILLEKGIETDAEQRKVTRYLVDRYNSMLAELAKRHSNLIYVDNRGLIGGAGEWADEIHPRSPGFSRLAKRFSDFIWAPRAVTSSAPPSIVEARVALPSGPKVGNRDQSRYCPGHDAEMMVYHGNPALGLNNQIYEIQLGPGETLESAQLQITQAALDDHSNPGNYRLNGATTSGQTAFDEQVLDTIPHGTPSYHNQPQVHKPFETFGARLIQLKVESLSAGKNQIVLRLSGHAPENWLIVCKSQINYRVARPN